MSVPAGSTSHTLCDNSEPLTRTLTDSESDSDTNETQDQVTFTFHTAWLAVIAEYVI